jgi:hypothetical protein
MLWLEFELVSWLRLTWKVGRLVTYHIAEGDCRKDSHIFPSSHLYACRSLSRDDLQCRPCRKVHRLCASGSRFNALIRVPAIHDGMTLLSRAVPPMSHTQYCTVDGFGQSTAFRCIQKVRNGARPWIGVG